MLTFCRYSLLSSLCAKGPLPGTRAAPALFPAEPIVWLAWDPYTCSVPTDRGATFNFTWLPHPPNSFLLSPLSPPAPTQPPGLGDPQLNGFYSLWTNNMHSLILLMSSPALTLSLLSSSLIYASAFSLQGLSTSCHLMVTEPISWLKLVYVGFCYNQDP